MRVDRLLAFRMTFRTLKHGNVSEIDRMLEGSIGFMTGLTLAICEAAEIDRMLYAYCFESCRGPSRIRDDRVADIAVIGNHFPCLADMFAIVTTKTTS